MKFCVTLATLVLFCSACSVEKLDNSAPGLSTAEDIGSPLYARILDLDAQVFEKGFNNCDLQALAAVTAEDFEFYHDQAGTNGSRESFIESINTYVCGTEYKAIRRLTPGTMVVFPLYRNNKLYGAIQTASHEFYALYPDQRQTLTDRAKLFTLWIKTKDGWKMRRSFSYDHKSYD